MTDPHTLPELNDALAVVAREIESYFAALPDAAFFAGDEARWSPAHHLSHLTLGHTRVGRGLQARAALPDHASGRSIGFAAIRHRYETELPLAPPEWLRNNPLPPRIRPEDTQASIVEDYAARSAGLREALATWSEADADAKEMKHPLFGPLTVRDMLAFFVIHDRHHLDGVRRRLASG